MLDLKGLPGYQSGRMKEMKTLKIGRQTAYYAAICAFLMLAMSMSDAGKPTAVAEDDAVETNGGDGETVVHIDVLANDSDPDNLIADIVVTTPAGFDGTAVRQGPDLDTNDPDSLGVIHVDYTIAPGFGGIETFTYKVVDSKGKTLDSATVNIDVDGSTATTKPGAHKVVFGGAAYPDSDVPLSAAGELAENAGTSTTQCCTVRDPRVRKGKGNTIVLDWTPFDLGAALSSQLAEGCSSMPKPSQGALIVPRNFSVHTANLDSRNPDDYRFGVCVVNTNVEWDGPMQVDIVAKPVVGYEVDCKVNEKVEKQPLTLGLSMEPKEFTAPQMRPITSECDPRGVARWSTWYFVVNAVHRIDKENSRGYVASLFSVLNSMIEEMRKTGAADTTFLRDLKSIVQQADGPATPPGASMDFLDNATLLALGPWEQDPYSPNGSFSNPKGELVSHLAALRYAVCSELAFPGALENCTMNPLVNAALPQLP
jgi:hypothetical protein